MGRHQLESIKRGVERTTKRNEAIRSRIRNQTHCHRKNDETQTGMDPQHMSSMWGTRRDHRACVQMPRREGTRNVEDFHEKVGRSPESKGHRTSHATSHHDASGIIAFNVTTGAQQQQPPPNGRSTGSTNRDWMAKLSLGTHCQTAGRVAATTFQQTGSRNTGRRWAIELAKKLMGVCWDMWQHRNDVLHNDGQNFHRKVELAKADASIREEHVKGKDTLLKQDKFLLKSLRTTLRMELNEKGTWLAPFRGPGRLGLQNRTRCQLLTRSVEGCRSG